MKYGEIKPGMQLIYYNAAYFYMVTVKSRNYHEAVIDIIEIANSGSGPSHNIFKNRVKNAGVWDRSSRFLQLDELDDRHRQFAFQLIFR